ncbi:MAG: hypothetical protein HOP29_11425 [Phycisphaerales bacterium]|nr:hypothetical protein [Phycisphaerales bacterium]
MQEQTGRPGTNPGIGKLAAVMIGVTDLDRSLAFYHEKLGLPLQWRHSDANRSLAFLDAQGVIVGLSTEVGKMATPQAGAMEVVFGVDSVQASYRALTSRGIQFLGEPKQATPTEWVANFRDPDGHLLSVFGPKG